MEASDLSLGVDIGGTKIEAALIDGEGRIVASRRRSSGVELAPSKAVADIMDCLAELRADAEGRAIGVVGLGIVGQIDSEAGVVRDSPNLPGWSNVYIRDDIERELGIPSLVINDVQAATWGEWQIGAGKGLSDMVCILVGTGIGGGIVSGGRLLTGSSGSAGEIGHTVIDFRGPPCHCGNNGCLEAHAGGWAIALRAQQARYRRSRRRARLCCRWPRANWMP